MDLDEDGQEIIARGHWTQAANGDTTYYPAHVRPRRLVGEPYEGWHETAPLLGEEEDEADAETDAEAGDAPAGDPETEPDDDPSDAFWDHPDAPARGDPRGGYRIRSQTVWGQARADYLAGDSAPEICDRYDLSLGAFRGRAAREGWRRIDADDALPEVPASDGEADLVGEADLDGMAADVLARAQRAIARGRAGEAATWLRVHRQLTRLIPAPPPVPSPAPEPPPEPDPLALLDLKMKAVGEVARAAASLDRDNAHGRAAVGALLAQLGRLPLAVGAAPISDDSDDSDCEFPDAAHAEGPPPDD